MFELFGRGHGKKASNVLVGEEGGREAVAFDYQYTTGSGKNRTTYYHQAVVLGLPINAARLRTRSENIFDRVASWVGWDDIDFESDEFSRRYHVKCDDRRFAYDVLHARLIEYLLAQPSEVRILPCPPLLQVYAGSAVSRSTVGLSFETAAPWTAPLVLCLSFFCGGCLKPIVSRRSLRRWQRARSSGMGSNGPIPSRPGLPSHAASTLCDPATTHHPRRTPPFASGAAAARLSDERREVIRGDYLSGYRSTGANLDVLRPSMGLGVCANGSRTSRRGQKRLKRGLSGRNLSRAVPLGLPKSRIRHFTEKSHMEER